MGEIKEHSPKSKFIAIDLSLTENEKRAPVFVHNEIAYFQRLSDEETPPYFSPEFFDELNKAYQEKIGEA